MVKTNGEILFLLIDITGPIVVPSSRGLSFVIIFLLFLYLADLQTLHHTKCILAPI